jgi:hypothetical protein
VLEELLQSDALCVIITLIAANVLGVIGFAISGDLLQDTERSPILLVTVQRREFNSRIGIAIRADQKYLF